jgi:Flp pilus assembly pilin Flp
MNMARLVLKALQFWKDDGGQDLVEYALTAAFVAVACAGFLSPFVQPGINAIFSKIVSLMAQS